MKNKLFVFIIIVLIVGVSFGVVGKAQAQTYPYYGQNYYGQNVCQYVGSGYSSYIQELENQFPQSIVNSVLLQVAGTKASSLTNSNGFYLDSAPVLTQNLDNAALQVDESSGYAFTYSNVGETIMVYPTCTSGYAANPSFVSPMDVQSMGANGANNIAEIGVGVSAGTYNGQNVLFVAEVFATQSQSQQPIYSPYFQQYQYEPTYIQPYVSPYTQPYEYSYPVYLSQSTASMYAGQSVSVTISGGSGGYYYVSNNSNSSIATASVNGNTLTVYGNSAGTDVLNVCSSNNNSSCAYLSVTVSNNVVSRPWYGFMHGWFGGFHLHGL
jgi:hypothetical protein